MSSTNETLTSRIQSLRKQKGFTQAKLASMLGLTDKAVSKWEAGEGNPDISLLPQLASIFGVTTDYLLTGKEPDKKIETISKYELCAKKDDPSLVTQIKNLGGIDENGDRMFDLMVKYGSAKVYSKIIEEKRLSELFDNQHRPAGSVSGIIYLSLISNTLDQMPTLFGFNDIAYADKKEWSDKAMDALLSDPRVDETTIQKVFSSHTIKYNRNMDMGNWQEIYPTLLDRAVIMKNNEKIDYILGVMNSINDEAVAAGAKDPNARIMLVRSDSISTSFEQRCIYAVGVSKSTVDSALASHNFDLFERLASTNRKVNGYVPSEKDIELEKMKANKSTSPDSIFLFSCIDDHVLNISKLLQSKNIELIKKAIADYPIHYYEYLEGLLVSKDYRNLFQFGVSHHFSEIASIVMTGQFNLLEDAIRKATFSFLDYHGNRLNINHEYFTKYGGVYGIDPLFRIEELKGMLSKTRNGIILDLTLMDEKSKVTSGLTKEYFDGLIKSGNTDMAIIKLCVKLEAILKCDRHLTGTFEEMLNKFCGEFETYDDEANDYDPVTPKLLNKLRMKRNAIVHSEKNDVALTSDELNQCIKYVFEIDGGQN